MSAKKLSHTITIAIVILLISSPLSFASAKYVFLFIGDGMATAQRTAAELYKNANAPDSFDDQNYKKLAMNSLPYQGLAYTYSHNARKTDSGAAATALATGHKTLYGTISMDHTKTQKLETIAETAKQLGLKVGIITTVTIDHATPAGFYAHQPSRSNYYEIAVELAQSNFDYFAGNPASGAASSKRRSRPNPYDLAKQNNFTIITDRTSFENLSPDPNQKIWVSPSDFIPYEIDRKPDDKTLTLPELTQKAIELLDNPNGFFIMIEGGNIDWACHRNDLAASVKETLALDIAIEKALDFYNTHPDDTLIVGPATPGYCIKQQIDSQKISAAEFESIVKKFRSEKTSFKDALPEIKKYFTFDQLTELETKRLTDAYQASMDPSVVFEPGSAQQIMYGTKDPLTTTCCKIISDRSGILWSSFNHSAMPVATSAIGQGAQSFTGFYQNSDIPIKILTQIKSE